MVTVEGSNSNMWLYESIDEIDLKVNKAMHRAKRAIMQNDRSNLIKSVDINAAGQEAIAADVLAEKIFLNTLIDEKLTGVLYSEESGVKKFGEPDENDPNSIVLLIDPLDGSQNYMKGLPFGCISVAYGKFSPDPTFSVLKKSSIMNLYAEEVYFAEKDIGAWFNGDELQSFDDRGLNSFRERNIQISYYAYGVKASRYYFDFEDIYTLRSLGSAAWELALVSDLRNDAFADIRGVLKAHDFAGAKIIIEALGGELNVMDLDPEEVENLPLDDFRSGYSVLASLDPNLLKHLRDDFQRHGLLD